MKKTEKTNWLDKIDGIIKNDSGLGELMLGASILYGRLRPLRSRVLRMRRDVRQ